MTRKSFLQQSSASKSLLARLGASFVRLGRDERGVSAVEFAMLLPLMLSLYLGAVEVSQAVAVDRKVTLAARAVADLVSQVKTIDNNELANVVDAATNVVAPFPESNLKITIRAIKIDAQGNVTTVWTYSGATGAVTDPTTPHAGDRLPARIEDRELHHLPDLGSGRIFLQAGRRIRHHRNLDAARPDLHASAPVGRRAEDVNGRTRS